MTDVKEMKELIDKIRGTKPEEEIKDKVEAIIKAEKDIKDAKTKASVDAKAKLLEGIKAEEEKLKKEGEEEEAEKKKKAAEKKKAKLNGEEEEEKTEGDSEEDTDESLIEKLTEQIEAMGKEVEALKKRKNYRTAPPKSKKVDAKDLPDFIVQNTQDIQNKDFEVMF